MKQGAIRHLGSNTVLLVDPSMPAVPLSHVEVSIVVAKSMIQQDVIMRDDQQWSPFRMLFTFITFPDISHAYIINPSFPSIYLQYDTRYWIHMEQIKPESNVQVQLLQITVSSGNLYLLFRTQGGMRVVPINQWDSRSSICWE